MLICLGTNIKRLIFFSVKDQKFWFAVLWEISCWVLRWDMLAPWWPVEPISHPAHITVKRLHSWSSKSSMWNLNNTNKYTGPSVDSKRSEEGGMRL